MSSDTTDRGKNIHKDTLCTCQLCSYLITVSLASVLSYNNQVCCLNVSISFHDTWKIRSITIHCTIDSRENYFEINVSALKHSAKNLIAVDLRTYCLKNGSKPLYIFICLVWFSCPVLPLLPTWVPLCVGRGLATRRSRRCLHLSCRI